MPNLATKRALHDISLGALACLVPHLIAFEAQLGIAIKRVMGILAAENAIRATPLIGTLLRHVTELLAITALYRRVVLSVVARHLVFQPREHIVLRRKYRVSIIFAARFLHGLVPAHLAIRRM